jgi:hypothetical protein
MHIPRSLRRPCGFESMTKAHTGGQQTSAVATLAPLAPMKRCADCLVVPGMPLHSPFLACAFGTQLPLCPPPKLAQNVGALPV